MSLSEEFENNFTIISDSREFKVDKFQIALRMTRFRKDPLLFLSGIYKVKSKCKDSIVENFIEAAKTGKCPELTLENAPSYQQLSIEFEFNSLFHACNSFILDQKDLIKRVSELYSQSINSPKTNLEKEATLNAIEIAFAFNLTQNHINHLKSLPNPVLYRILSNPGRPVNQNEKLIYDIIEEKIESGDQEAKLLLQTINYSSLGHNELSFIMNHNKKSKQPSKQNQTQTQQQSQNSNHSQNNNTNKTNQPPPHPTTTTTSTSTPTNQSQISHSQSLVDKTEGTNKTPSQSRQKSKISRVPASNRASSTNSISDSFQGVYIPENSDLKQSISHIVGIVNSRRSHGYQLTLNQGVSGLLQNYYGSLETVKQPTETDYLILGDRFSYEVQRRHLIIALDENENKLYDLVQSEVNKIPIEDIANANFLALTVVKVINYYYTAIVIGNSEQGTDQIDPNPPINQSNSSSNLPLPSSKQSNSTPTFSGDLNESVKAAFYQTDKSDDIHDIFFNEEYSSQLLNYLEKSDKNNEKISIANITQNVPCLKGYQVNFKFNNQIKPILEYAESQNRNKNGCLIALATKKYNNNKFACILAFVTETFSDEQKELISLMKTNFKDKRINLDYNAYKILTNFLSEPKDLIEMGENLDPLKLNNDSIFPKDQQYKYVFLKNQNLGEIFQKIPTRYRNKIALAAKINYSIKKLEKENSYQFIMVYLPKSC